MKGELALARGWLEQAHSDLARANHMLKSDGPYDTAFFHAQQAVEKSLKEYLIALGHIPPRTHDVEELARLCDDAALLPLPATAELADLTRYAVELRYDAFFWPAHSEAADAVGLAERVWEIVLAHIPPAARPS